MNRHEIFQILQGVRNCGLGGTGLLSGFHEYVDHEVAPHLDRAQLELETTDNGFMIRVNGRYSVELREQYYSPWSTVGYVTCVRDLRGYAQEVEGEVYRHEDASGLYDYVIDFLTRQPAA